MAGAGGATAAIAVAMMIDMAHNGADIVSELLGVSDYIVEKDPMKLHPTELSLSESLALIWQDNKSGNVSGRLSDEQTQTLMVCAAMIDLLLCGRIVLGVKEKLSFFSFGSGQSFYVLVKDKTPTGQDQLDYLLDYLSKKQDKLINAGKEGDLVLKIVFEKLVLGEMFGFDSNPKKTITLKTFESLARRKIVNEEKYKKFLFNFKRYPNVEGEEKRQIGVEASLSSLVDDNGLPMSVFPLILLRLLSKRKKLLKVALGEDVLKKQKDRIALIS